MAGAATMSKRRGDDDDDWDPDSYRTAEELQDAMDDGARARMSAQEQKEMGGTASCTRLTLTRPR